MRSSARLPVREMRTPLPPTAALSGRCVGAEIAIPRERVGGAAGSRRGVALLIVLWVVAICSVLIVAIQASSLRQALSGREAVGATRAKWAARAGVEAMLTALTYNTENPDLADAFQIELDMGDLAEGNLSGTSYFVGYSYLDKDILGARDEHSRINLAMMDQNSLMLLPLMTEDVAMSIIDWMDADDDVQPLGAELGQYASLPYPYEPRNGPMPSLLELELVLGVDPALVRGEDWNLNGLLDPEENDGRAFEPWDNADGILDAEWGEFIGVRSRSPGLGVSGEERLILSDASESDVQQLLQVDATQAKIIVALVAEAQTLGQFISTQLNTVIDPATNQPIDRNARDLTRDQLAILLDETALTELPPGALPGKLNINTCDEEVLEYVPGMTFELADAIVSERESRLGNGGFLSIVDLLDIEGMTAQVVAALYESLDTRSTVYTATSRGRDEATGVEYEMIVTFDRSTLPVSIRELRVR